MGSEQRRSARLLLADEPGPGRLDPAALEHRLVARAVASRPVPPAPRRLLERVLMKAGALTYERTVAAPLTRARRAALGERASGPPRFLVRVDEYPCSSALDDPGLYGQENFARFEAIMASAGIPYLLAITPVISRAHTDPTATEERGLEDAELETIRTLPSSRITLATHGLDHRTRHADPRRHSELTGLDPAALRERLDRSEELIRRAGVPTPRVFVPPFNRFDAAQYPFLAERYDVVCGGPESVALMGYHRTPLWRGDAVYLPSYPPLYSHAAEVLPAAQRLIAAEQALWVPIVLHWKWEVDRGWSGLERLVEALAPHAVSWNRFLDAVEESRG